MGGQEHFYLESQAAIAELAAQIFHGGRDPWAELAKTNLLGLAAGEDVGGTGLGLIEICVLLEQQGRVARVQPIHHVRCSSRPVSDTRSGV